MRKFLYILLGIAFPVIGLGQLHPILESFGARQLDNAVRLDFGVKGGAQCNGVQLQRIDQEGEYQNIDAISGVCGGSEFTEFYSLNDPDPFSNQINTYRLILGNQGPSAPVEILFTPVKEDVLIYPNPSMGEVNIRWNAPDGEVWQLGIYEANGKSMLSDFQVTAPAISLMLPEHLYGMYQLILTSESGEVFAKRLMILRE